MESTAQKIRVATAYAVQRDEVDLSMILSLIELVGINEAVRIISRDSMQL